MLDQAGSGVAEGEPLAKRDADIPPVVEFQDPLGVGGAVALALRYHRVAAGLAIRDLSRASGVSSPMISRIENAQVSPSLSTLESLAAALKLPVISLFEHTIKTADIQFVKAGQGIAAKRFAPEHNHDYRMLASFTDQSLRFSAAQITLRRADNGTHPFYFARGYVLLTITEGECVYSCGGTTFDLGPGDYLSFDAQLRHGVQKVVTETVTFVAVSSNRT